jgi:hypothetical protein
MTDADEPLIITLVRNLLARTDRVCQIKLKWHDRLDCLYEGWIHHVAFAENERIPTWQIFYANEQAVPAWIMVIESELQEAKLTKVKDDYAPYFLLSHP